jgi:hypothetical protein
MPNEAWLHLARRTDERSVRDEHEQCRDQLNQDYSLQSLDFLELVRDLELLSRCSVPQRGFR